MTFTDAAAEVLRLVGRPLHYKEITDLAIEKNLLSHVGKSPEVTMGARLAATLKKDSADNPLVRVKPGVFALREWSDKTIKAALEPKPKKDGRRSHRADAVAGRAAEGEDGESAAGATAGSAEGDNGAQKQADDDDEVLIGSSAEEDDEPVVEEDAPTEEIAIRGEAIEADAHAAEEPADAAPRAPSSPAPALRAEAAAAPAVARVRAERAERAEDADDEVDDEVDEEPPGPDDVMRAEAAAGAAEMFDEEDDDDQPILGGGDDRAAPQAGEQGEGRRRRRRRRRGRTNGETQVAVSSGGGGGGLPSYTATPAFDNRRERDGADAGSRAQAPVHDAPRAQTPVHDSPAAHPGRSQSPGHDGYRAQGREGGGYNNRRGQGERFPRAEEGRYTQASEASGHDGGRPQTPGEAPYRPQVIELTGGEGHALDDLAGRELSDAVAVILSTFDRNAGAVSLRTIAETAQRRGRLAGDAQLAQSQIAAAVRADNARRIANGQRPRFRFAGGRVALTDWLLSGDLARLEQEALAAVERYRDAARRAFARKLGELPGHAFVEVCVLALEKIGLSQLRALRRAGVPGGESHFSGVLRAAAADELKLAVVIRRDGREVGRERVADLRGSLHHYGPANAGWIFTAGQMLSGAREEAAVPGTAPISLFDGLAVARLCEENDVAVIRARLPVAIPDVDLLEALRAS